MAEITRADALALINQQNMNEIWQEVPKSSAALRTFNQIPMTAKQMKVRVLDVLPAANGSAWVNGDTGRKPTLDMAWANKFLEAEEIAGIVPIPENVFDDTDADIWGLVKPRIAEYVGYHLDLAVFLGTGAPASWPDSLAEGAIAAGNVLDLSTYSGLGTQAQGYDLAGAFNELLGIVEDDGYEADIVWSKNTMKRRIRNLRDQNGNTVYSAGVRGSEDGPTIWGVTLDYITNTALADANTLAIAGSRRNAILGIRKDMEFKFLDQATLTQDMMVDVGGVPTPVKVVTASLAEQDMVALRFKMRVGFQVADPTTLEGGAGAYPAAVLVA